MRAVTPPALVSATRSSSGVDVAVKLHASAGEDKPLADQRQRASQQVEPAGHLRIARRTGDVDIAGRFRVDAVAVQENPVRRRDRERERRVEQRRSRMGRLLPRPQRQQRPGGRRRVEVPRAGNGGRDAVEALGHGDVHRDDRDAAADVGRLGEPAGDIEPHIRGRCDDVVGDKLSVPASHLERARKAPDRIEPHFAADLDRAGVRRGSCEPVDADGVPVRLDEPADRGELESGLVVAEGAAGQPDRPLRLRLGDGPAELHRHRERARNMTAIDRKRDVGEAGVEPAVDLHVERAVGAEGRGAGQADRIAGASIDREVKRSAAPAKPAGAGDIERRRGGASGLRRADLLQAQTPVAGWIVGRSADRRLAVGDAGKTEARRENVERRKRQPGRCRAKVERRAGAAGDGKAARVELEARNPGGPARRLHKSASRDPRARGAARRHPP